MLQIMARVINVMLIAQCPAELRCSTLLDDVDNPTLRKQAYYSFNTSRAYFWQPIGALWMDPPRMKIIYMLKLILKNIAQAMNIMRDRLIW